MKDLLDDAEVSLKRAGVDQETVEGYLVEEDTEILMNPAEYTLEDTPVFLYVFITDGYTNEGARFHELDEAGTRYVLQIIQDFYTDAEQPEYSAGDIGEERYIIVDSLYYSSDGITDTPTRNYYTIWNGDFVQVEVVFTPEYREEAIQWTEEFLATWTDAEES